MKKRKSPKSWVIFVLSLTMPLFLSSFALSEETYVFERMWPTLQQPWYFNEPNGVAIDGSGNVYVADTENHRIQKFTSDGTFVTMWGSSGTGDGQFHNPWGVAADGSGNVYVGDLSGRIQKFTSDGTFVTKWGSSGTGDGQFDEPGEVAIDGSGNVYVTDAWNHRIQKFTSDGTFLTKWGSFGTGDGQFYNPYGIAIDGSGNVYVTDTWNHRIQKFTSDGTFLTKWGSEGTGDGQFYTPRGIAIDGIGNVYVAEFWNKRIQKFTSDGTFIAKWGDGRGTGNGMFKLPDGIAIDGSGNVYAADSENHRIQKFTSDGTFLAKWGSYGTGDGEFDLPGEVAIDGSGNVYITDTWNYRIQKFTPDGTFITKWGSQGTGDGQFSYIDGIAIDKSGNVYVADSFNNRVQKFTSDGAFITKWGSEGTGDGQFHTPRGIAIDGTGNVYVADDGNDRIQKFTSDGTFVSKWGSGGTGDGQFWGNGGTATDGSGNVYVAERWNNRVQKFTSDGQFITKFGGFGTDAGQLNQPSGLCVGTDGRIYVADSANNRVQVFKEAELTTRLPKAIIVAGGGPFAGNNIWDATQMCANYAYRALTHQGYTKDTIYYLTPNTDLDLDNDGVFDDVDADATVSNLEYAITSWAQDAEDLFIYMVGHGAESTFRIGAAESLYASVLDTRIDNIQGIIPGTVALVYDACRSGSFLPILDPPAGKQRILATSASADEEAIFGSQGTISFSFLFWARMFNVDSFYDSFCHATNSLGVTYPQTPLLEGNGNGIGNETPDKEAAQALTIGNQTRFAGDIPVIGSVSPAQTLDGNPSCLIYAQDVIDADGISRVWAVITPPGYSPDSPDNPVTDLPILDLSSVGYNRYEATYNNFTITGTYNIAIYAKDGKGVISLPKSTIVITATISQEDSYEEDDTFGQANVIDLNGGPQQHNFHDAGDQDWVKFYGISGEIYEVKISNSGALCDAVIELYDTDGTTLLKGPWSWGFEGEDELMDWSCSQDGIYYVMLSNDDPEVFGENTRYDLEIYRPVGPFPGFIEGIITDASSGDPVAGAEIRTDGNASALSHGDGNYLMVDQAGTYTITACATGYDAISYSDVVVPEAGTVTKNFELVSIGEEAPVASFTGSPISGSAPLTVDFTDESTGEITSWSWDFGDGDTATEQNPTHTYTESGTYTVSLTVTGPGGSDTETKTDYITVSESGEEAPVASFTGSSISGSAPLTVDFTDESTGEITSWSWDFGDGDTATEQNPTHTYTESGTYTVSLTVTGPGGSDTETKTDYITVSASDGPETGYLVTSDLWIRAVVNTVEKGPIEAVWKKGGEDVTARGDTVIWGHFYASPSDVTWGSPDNPDLFVKIWFDVSGRIDVNFFHVSVPDIKVYSEYPYDGTHDEHGITTMDRRYIRQYYEEGQSHSEDNYEDGVPAAGYSPAGNPWGSMTINNLRIGSIINTVEKGPIDAVWRPGGQDTTARGDQVVWGHFYASPSDVTWGSQDNPDLFVKIWFDESGRVDVNFFHVSVPDIEVYSDLPSDANYDQQGTTIMADRYIRHEYWK